MAIYNIRLATSEDVPVIVQIATSAVAKFGTIPELAHLAKGESFMTAKIQQSLEKGRIFLAEQHGDTPVGFLGAYQVDSALYIAEVSVSNDHNGKGIGGMLIEAVLQWARDRARANNEDEARVSLTTYAEVPWNGPWYGKRGFKVVDAAIVGPKHVEKMRYDREVRDLNRPGYTRCCMLWREKLEAVEAQ